MDDKKRPHSLEDHLLGIDPMHSHEDGEADHDHDHDDAGEYDPTATSLWAQDNITLTSVGIDIGSAGTQVIFSRVQLRRLSEDLTSRYFVVNRETLAEVYEKVWKRTGPRKGDLVYLPSRPSLEPNLDKPKP